MKILHVAASLDPERGGPTTVVIKLTQALARKGIDVSVFAASEDATSTYTRDLQGVTARIFPTSFISRIWPYHSPAFAEALKKESANFDLIHVHEIWHHAVFCCYRVAKAGKIPFLVTSHGTLEPWCLNQKALKKKIYSALIQKKILRKANALHAVAEEEIPGIAEFANNRRIYYVPNGLSIQDFENLPEKKRLETLYAPVKGNKVILFLGRIHPKKGLDILAEAFGKVAKKQGNVCLLIAGPNNDGYQANIEKILSREGVRNKAIFTGTLAGSQKLAALSGADIFVLPSHSEGFSISVLEAMYCGLPVVITKQCHFPEVDQMQAGRIINNDVVRLSETIIELLGNPELCRKMGRAGRRLVEDRYTWDKAADKMICFYEEILRDFIHNPRRNRK